MAHDSNGDQPRNPNEVVVNPMEGLSKIGESTAKALGTIGIVGGEIIAAPNPERVELIVDNMTSIRESFIESGVKVGKFNGAEDAKSAIAERIASFGESGLSLAIGMSSASLLRLLRTGSHDTHWDHIAETGDATGPTTQRKSRFETYDATRRVAEQGLLPHAKNPSTEQPNYAFVIDKNAEPTFINQFYGNVQVRLAGNLDREDVVYHVGDSFTSVSHEDASPTVFEASRIIQASDVPEVQAMLEIINQFNVSHGMIGNNLVKAGTPQMAVAGVSGYLEASIFDRVKAADIEEMTIDIGLTGSQEADKFFAFPQIVQAIEAGGFSDKVTLRMKGASDIAIAWAKQKYRVQLGTEQTDGSNQTRDLAERLGINISDEYATVSDKLRKRAAELQAKIYGPNSGRVLSTNPRTMLQSISRLREDSRSVIYEQKRDSINELTEIEKARLFFQG